MKTKYIIAFLLFFSLFSCNQTKKGIPNNETAQDSVTIITQAFKNSPNVIELEVPVLRGTQTKHGVQKRFYLHGSLYSEIPYKNGNRNGIALTYYPGTKDAKPIVWKEQPYINNKLEGICRRYHQNGKLQAEYEYKNGLPATGLKEYYQSGNPVKFPDLTLKYVRTADNYFITAKLTNGSKKVDFFIGDLVEGKYLPKTLKGLQVVNGVGEILVPLSAKEVTITALNSTDYSNSYIISKKLSFK